MVMFSALVSTLPMASWPFSQSVHLSALPRLILRVSFSTSRPHDGTSASLRHFWHSGAGLEPWTDEEHLAEILARGLVHYQPDRDPNGLVVLNKPPSLPISGCEECPVGLKEALPPLAAILGVKKLFYVKAPER